MASKIYANINFKVLNWAIESSGFSIEELAKKANISVTTLEAARQNKKKLTMNQLRRLRNKVKRPIAIFYLKKIPEAFHIPDFRRSADEPWIPPSLRIIIRDFREKKENAVFLADLNGIKYDYSKLNNLALSENPTEAGHQIRELLDIDFNELKKLRDSKVLNYWKSKIEALGIMIFQFKGINPSVTRGFSFSEQPLPLIAINQRDSYYARVFTMIHEFVHVLLGKEGLCDSELHFGEEHELETHCNEIASNTMVPLDLLQSEIINKQTDYKRTRTHIESLSNTYKASYSVILIQLSKLGKIESSIKTRIIKELKSSSKKPTKGGMSFYTLFFSSNSKLYLTMVSSAFDRDLITLTNVATYLGTRYDTADRLLTKFMEFITSE